MREFLRSFRLRHFLFVPLAIVGIGSGRCVHDPENCRIIVGQFVFFNDAFCGD
jgi:hypothetical protein